MDAPSRFTSSWRRLGELVLARPRAMVAAVLVVAALAGAAAGLFLRVRPGYVDLLDERSPLQRRYLALIEKFGNVESLHVIIEGVEDERLDRFIDLFAAKVLAARDARGRPMAARVLDHVDGSWFVERLPALLPSDALAALASTDRDLRGLVLHPEPDRILAQVRDELDRAAASGAHEVDPQALAGLGSLLGAMERAAAGQPEPVSRWLLERGGMPSRLDPRGHVRLDARRLLVTIAPADTANDYQVIAPFLAAVRSAADAARAESGAEVKLSFTGAPALIVDEMQAVSRDVALAAILSLVLVTLLFFVSFGALRHVLFAGLANIAGLALTFGAALLLVGYLNLFSAVFAAVLAGLGIDFGIHIINHYEARRREGLPAREALLAVFGSAVPAIVASAITTAAAFLAIVSSEFAGFAQLGLISGVGVLVCVAMSITLVPALLAWDASRGASPAPERPPWSQRPLMAIPRHAGGLTLLGLALAAAAAWQLPRVRFDHDLMNLQPAGTEAVRLQQASDQRVATHDAFSLASDLATARERGERFAALPSVAQVTSAASFLPVPDEARARDLKALAARLSDLPEDEGGPVDVEAARVQASLLVSRLQDLQDLAFEGGNERAVTALDALLAAGKDLRSALDLPSAASGLETMRDDLAASLRAMAARLPELAARPLSPADLPDTLRAHFVGSDGTLAIIIEPRGSVWDRPALAAFVRDLREVDPEVTGPSVQVFEMTEMMRASLLRAAWIAAAAIVVLVILTLRDAAGTVLGLLPLGLGFLLMLGAMSFLGVPLNPANLVALPLLLGIGVDGGVHVAHRWLEVRDAARTIRDVGHPLLITSLTTVAGFLPLLLARHRGIRSLGVITCIGSLTMLLSAVVLVPAFLAMLDRLKSSRRPAPGGGA